MAKASILQPMEDLRAKKLEAAKLHFEGMSPMQVAQAMSLPVTTVRNWLTEARTAALSSQKEHFNNQLALFLDDAFSRASSVGELLADRDFLLSAEPDRIEALNSVFATTSDRLLMVLAAAGRANASNDPARSQEGI